MYAVASIKKYFLAFPAAKNFQHMMSWPWLFTFLSISWLGYRNVIYLGKKPRVFRKLQLNTEVWTTKNISKLH